MTIKIIDENEEEKLWLSFGTSFCPICNGVFFEDETHKCKKRTSRLVQPLKFAKSRQSVLPKSLEREDDG